MSSSNVLAVDVVALLANPLVNADSLKVSNRSCIYEVLWDFTEDLEHRPRSINDSSLKVNWGKWPFSIRLRRELQHIFCLYRFAPSAFSSKKVSKANTTCALFNRTLDFFSDMVLRFPSADMVESIDQIEWVDVKSASAIYSGSSFNLIRQGLKILFHPTAEKALGKSFRIGPQDIKRLFKVETTPSGVTKELVRKKLEGPAMMSDEMFSLLSDASSARVKDFLQRLNLMVEDGGIYEYSAPREIQDIKNFPLVFELYENLRRVKKGIPIANDTPAKLQYKFNMLGVRVGALSIYLAEVNIAAQCSLGLYMGGRFSELTSLEVGCLDERDGVPCIIGRNFKGRSDKDLHSDSWVAIPIMRDSVRALEALERLKNNKFLVSPFETSGGSSIKGNYVRSSGLSFSNNAFSKAVQRYIHTIDNDGRFTGWSFSSHQFKHSLARQMIKAKLGLPYISFHLKHLHSRVATLPSDITLGYGNAGKILQTQASGLQMHEVRRELAERLFDPNSHVHGGGAMEFDERRKAYFKGMADAGLSKEQIMDELARLAAPSFVNVGLGFCTGRKDSPGTDEKPPCIGSLRCNPNRCANAIVTKEAHGAAWRSVYLENKKMARDPRFAYARKQFEAAAYEAQEVLIRLGEDISNE